MNQRVWALSDDLSLPIVVVTLVILTISLVLLSFELRQRERYGVWIFTTGLLGLVLVAAAVLRPVVVDKRGSVVGSRVVVLVDQSRRLLLPEGDRTRRALAFEAARDLVQHYDDARIEVLGFGDDEPERLALERAPEREQASDTRSDLLSALERVLGTPGERPRAVVVISDGRLSRPADAVNAATLRQTLGHFDLPIHTVYAATRPPKDASVRAVRAAGAAVAHQPLTVKLDIGCVGLDCSNVPVKVRELLHGEEPAILATGVANVEAGEATIELDITLERAGPRVVEFAIDAPDGDVIEENDTRIITFDVARDRVRLLHVAGRPTYDVRALRRWLKADESIDLVAFFILRTETDDPQVSDDSELALIPFPVDELFTEHLPSFDAIILQDIDAVTYKLSRHLPAIESYVRAGGGLIMVGGPASFIGGGYAGTGLERVLPISLNAAKEAFEVDEFVPRYTEAGRAAPVLKPVRELLGERLPEMPGSNTLGAATDNALVLWEHPSRKVGERAMPVLVVGEAGDGRSIALGVDGTHQLAFSELTADSAGRAYGALWEGLIGWLMRDPRYEAARVELVGECIAGQPATLRLFRLPGSEGEVSLELVRLGTGQAKPRSLKLKTIEDGAFTDVVVGRLEAGGYSARARIGAAPPTRFDFACERGGEAWSDSRPDPERLERVANASGGEAVTFDDVSALPAPPSTEVAAERHVTPVMPPWAWALFAAVTLGAHWMFRRRGGLI